MIDYATFTNRGSKECNEDAVKVFINQPLFTYGFTLADGLGGHGNGDVASNLVVDCVGAVLENSSEIDTDFLDNCFNAAQNILMAEKEARGLPSIKSTLVVLIIDDKHVSWGHIGDSRLYSYRKGKKLTRTIDHSVPQMLALSGEIKESEIRHHPNRNMLLSALGAEWDAPAYEIDKINRRVTKGDSYLLCSDGFWDWIDEKAITSILKKDLSAYDALNQMVAIVEENGLGKDMDNYSAILVNVK